MRFAGVKKILGGIGRAVVPPPATIRYYWPAENSSTDSSSIVTPVDLADSPYILDSLQGTLATGSPAAQYLSTGPRLSFVNEKYDVTDGGSPLALSQLKRLSAKFNFTTPVSDQNVIGGTEGYIGVDSSGLVFAESDSGTVKRITADARQADASDDLSGTTLDSSKWSIGAGSSDFEQDNGWLWTYTKGETERQLTNNAGVPNVSDGTIAFYGINVDTKSTITSVYLYWRFSVNGVNHTWRNGAFIANPTDQLTLDGVEIITYEGLHDLRLHNNGANWLAQYNIGSGWITAATYPLGVVDVISQKFTLAVGVGSVADTYTLSVDSFEMFYGTDWSGEDVEIEADFENDTLTVNEIEKSGDLDVVDTTTTQIGDTGLTMIYEESEAIT